MPIPSRAMLALLAALAATIMTAGLIAALGLPLWQADGVGLCVADGDQWKPQLVSDGAGGAIVAWEDKRDGSQYDIYAQRVDDHGNALWTANGTPVCVAANEQRNVQLISNGSGGAILTWYDSRPPETGIFAQGVDQDGNALWTADGVSLCVAPGAQYDPQIVSDGSGGAIVTWHDYRLDGDIYAQRVDSDGNTLWAADGVSLCTATDDQGWQGIAPDGAGGAIVAWEDYRSGYYGDIYAQSVDSMGVISWTTDGVSVCVAADFQVAPQVPSDGSGGAFVAYMDSRSGEYDVYAQRLDSNGNPLWATNGISVCAASGEQYEPQIAADSEGGLFVTWQDTRPAGAGIYAQRVNSNGTPLWATDGASICVISGIATMPQIIPDSSGGAIITWYDNRSGSGHDIYAQRIDADANALWQANGVPLCSADNDQRNPQLVTDGAGGTVIAWYDNRLGTNKDIYAQRVIDLVPTDFVNLPLVARKYP